jgi:predicted permease
MFSPLLPIFLDVIIPILLVIMLGALMHRIWRLEITTLNRLSMYLLVPAFLFVKVYESQLSWLDIGQITGGVFIPLLMVGVPLFLVARRAGAPGNTVAALLVGGLVFNAGNFGLPVAQLYYEKHGAMFPGMIAKTDGAAVQALIIMLSNISVWLLGYGVVALGKGHGLRGMLGFFRLPMIYVLVMAFALRESGTVLPTPVYGPLEMLAVATVPVMLVTLGAQLAEDAQLPNWRLIGPAMIIKLAVLPAVTALVVWLCGLWPWPGAQIIIASAAPTAVNTLLLSIELDGDARTAADCVFWTTIAAAVSVTCVLAIVEQLAAI